jgi:glycosyltransferase involved in cell wall biosynthesis
LSGFKFNKVLTFAQKIFNRLKLAKKTGVGEFMALRGNGFDKDFYLRSYPDIAASGVDPEKHYHSYGQREGRLGRQPALEVMGSFVDDFDLSRENILIVSHEASLTGAPILSLNLVRLLSNKYNVVALLLGDGALIGAFRDCGAVVVGPCSLRNNSFLAQIMIRDLLGRCNFKFALVNSIESRVVLPELAANFVPVISLLHEFAAYTRPREAFRSALLWSGDVVFSADLTLQSALAEYPDIKNRTAYIIPQGRCLIPAKGVSQRLREVERARLFNVLRPASCSSDTFLVVGMGSIQLRKGVDIFIDCVSRIVASKPRRPFRFVWIGKGYDPENDINYSVYLSDQIQRFGIEEYITIIGESHEIDVVYEQADVLLLTSRLDPLPNVAIDALSEGVPVVCFDKTTGIADFLSASGLQSSCVAGFLDSVDMAHKVLQLAADSKLYQDVANKSQSAAIEQFKMERYVSQLEELADSVIQRKQQEVQDIAEIVKANVLRAEFCSLPGQAGQSPEELAAAYVRAWASGIDLRKPFPGFHPGVYLEQHGVKVPSSDPLADFLRSGRPQGAWLSPVITPWTKVGFQASDQKVALHLHVYYPELLTEIMNRLMNNQVRPDLFVSVPSEAVREQVSQQLSSYSGRVVECIVVPNLGRDIGPFLTGFAAQLATDYDVVGHLHTKASVDVADSDMGRSWYRFLLENLLGGECGAMADKIIATMQLDPTIGLVFPDDPSVTGWCANKIFAEPMASKLDIKSLPDNFVFPVGTMFWASAKALAPFWGLGLSWDDYPSEPLPYDGSTLHALERLFPLALVQNGWRCAVTNVEAVTR